MLRSHQASTESFSTKIEGSSLPGAAENFLFGQVARLVYPIKTDHQLARIGNASDRAARDWLSGKVSPPAIVAADLLLRILERR